MTFAYRQNESGQPWLSTRGKRGPARGPGVHDVDTEAADGDAEARQAASAASCAGQSNPSAQ